MRVLGISCFHRDSAAVLVVDGKPVAAAKEEHFTRLAHDPAFPSRAIRCVLAEGGVAAPNLDHVVFYEKPLKKFERVLVGNLRGFPRSSTSFAKGLFLWLGDRIWIKNRIAQDLGVAPEKILFSGSLQAMAQTAFQTSPFDESAVLVLDDAAEWSTTLLARAARFGNNRAAVFEELAEVRFPHSLGLLDSAVTQFLGFSPGEDEHKVEALAAHGEPRFLEGMSAWVSETDGLFSLDPDAFRFGFDSSRLYEDPFEQLFGPPRFAGDPLRFEGADKRDADIAASLQALLETHTLRLAVELHRRAPSANLCFGGALARNRKLCHRLASEGPFANLHVPAAPGKDGAALGAALLAEPARMDGNGFGLSLVGETIGDMAEPGARELDDAEGEQEVARRLALGERIAWVTGGVELGPRSLENRIVLSDVREPDARSKLLLALQHVERFLPCRVLVPAQDAGRFFELPDNCGQAGHHGHLRAPATQALRTSAPSVVDPLGLAWPQVVDSEQQPRLYRLLRAHEAATGLPLLLVADFSLRGSPLVRNEAEAVEAFQRSTLDALVARSRVYGTR